MIRTRHQKIVRTLVKVRRPRHVNRLVPSTVGWCQLVPVLGYAVIGGLASRTYCEARVISSQYHEPLPRQLVPVRTKHASTWSRYCQQFLRGWKILVRLLKLTLTLAPVATFCPLLLLMNEPDPGLTTQDKILLGFREEPDHLLLGWYLRLCRSCVESSGAAVIKLMQWASSRPDLFGHDFCAAFSKLQDHTTPHKWRHTDKMMRQAYGDSWEEKIRLGEILGSGCIGQVYRGQTTRPDGSHEEVAVKVLHPSLEEDINADLDIMHLMVYIVEAVSIFPSLKWLNLPGVVEEFADLLKLQLDLRREAENLTRFNKNFENDDFVIFPKLIPQFPSTKNVLVESYLDGIPVLQFARQNQSNRSQLHDLCVKGIRGVCKMIFLDNFLHGATK
jgi:predicted unusual protein kinase regulating ubiquinone biosynthesis (AarF/ABC1/UbiB family)